MYVQMASKIPFLRRNFLVIAHRARSDSSFSLNDLCGAAGRWDGIARCITAALHLSHDMRRDTAVHILLLGPEDPPKVVSVLGSEVRFLNPDERATAALMRKCLDRSVHEGDDPIKTSPGIYVTRIGLEGFLRAFAGPFILLDEEGADVFADPNFIAALSKKERWLMLLSDDQDLTVEEEELISGFCPVGISVSPMVLHSYQAIILAHSIADR